MLEHSSARLSAVAWTARPAISHPQMAPPVPLYPKLYAIVVATDGRRPRTLNYPESVSFLHALVESAFEGAAWKGGWVAGA